MTNEGKRSIIRCSVCLNKNLALIIHIFRELCQIPEICIDFYPKIARKANLFIPFSIYIDKLKDTTCKGKFV